MKKVTYFRLPMCPFCLAANRWISEVLREHPEYEKVELNIVDENRNRKLANQYDYYFVPTFYVNDEKVHEGTASKEIVENVFRKAYEES